jgi:hypothetical protein
VSGRFTLNFVVVLLGAGLVVIVFALSAPAAEWVGLGVGGAAILAALYGFALADQGAYQRVADVVICATGAWTIVAARVLTYNGRWLEVGAGAGLAALGAVGLVVREASLARGLQVGRSRLGPDQLLRRSALHRDDRAST